MNTFDMAHSMFGLFDTHPYHHPDLGQLKRSRGHWRGTIHVMGRPVALVLSGTGKQPDPAAVDAACTVLELPPELRLAIEQALLQHYEPSLDAYRHGSLDIVAGSFPLIKSVSEVWAHVTLVHIAVTPVDGLMTTELGYETAWDIEHTLGARFVGSRFIELNGSVLRP